MLCFWTVIVNLIVAEFVKYDKTGGSDETKLRVCNNGIIKDGAEAAGRHGYAGALSQKRQRICGCPGRRGKRKRRARREDTPQM